MASVAVSPTALSLVLGQSQPQQLTATIRDQAGTPLVGRTVAWATSAPAVATVSSDGLVTAVGTGSATINATSEGKTGSASVTVTLAPGFVSVATGGAHTCALKANGVASCWGRGESGQLGVPVPTTMCTTDSGPFPCSMIPIAVQGGLVFAQLAGGGAHTCGLTSDGTALCWGSNANGQLGDNSTTNRDAPVAVATPLTMQRIAAGGSSIGHTCALVTGGDVYCWGDNERGQLGIGTGGTVADLTPHPEPAKVSGGLTFTAVTAGLGRHTCGLTSTGGAYCWGENAFGALGNGSFQRSAVPVLVRGGLVLAQVVAGGFIGHTCGVTGSGTAHCWGENETGQIGDGSTLDRPEPSAVTGGLLFTSLDAGSRHTCGRATDGAVYCWGSGGGGQLGVNSTSAIAVPTKVAGQS